MDPPATDPPGDLPLWCVRVVFRADGMSDDMLDAFVDAIKARGVAGSGGSIGDSMAGYRTMSAVFFVVAREVGDAARQAVDIGSAAFTEVAGPPARLSDLTITPWEANASDEGSVRPDVKDPSRRQLLGRIRR
jgi:hypothetical protein